MWMYRGRSRRSVECVAPRNGAPRARSGSSTTACAAGGGCAIYDELAADNFARSLDDACFVPWRGGCSDRWFSGPASWCSSRVLGDVRLALDSVDAECFRRHSRNEFGHRCSASLGCRTFHHWRDSGLILIPIFIASSICMFSEQPYRLDGRTCSEVEIAATHSFPAFGKDDPWAAQITCQAAPLSGNIYLWQASPVPTWTALGVGLLEAGAVWGDPTIGTPRDAESAISRP